MAIKYPEILQRNKFPHLLEIENILFVRFLKAHGKNYQNFEFDLHVGEGVKSAPGQSASMAAAFKALTQKRIDAIGWSNSQPTIFEIRPRVNQTAAGNLLLYGHLFRSAFPSTPEPQLAIITDRTVPDIEKFFATMKIELYTV